MTKMITILGSTGSIGRQTLSVAEELGLRVAALTAERNVELLEAQCRKYRPRLAVLANETAAEELKVRLADMNIRVLAGAEALCEAAALPEAEVLTFDGLSHLFTPVENPTGTAADYVSGSHVSEDVIDAIAQWILNTK